MKWLSHMILRTLGWSFVGELPDSPKMVIIGAPHTSNWDLILYLATIRHLGISPKFLIKHTVFRWPFGYLFRSMGGIPVDRSGARGLVHQVRDQFDSRESMILVIAPEGTRKRTERWKSGFIKIAETADVPVVCAGVDYPTRTVTIGPALDLADGRKEFMEQARAFYADKTGRHGDQKGPVVVRDEG